MCRKILAVPLSARGKTVKCKNCQVALRVPAGDTSAAPKKKAS